MLQIFASWALAYAATSSGGSDRRRWFARVEQQKPGSLEVREGRDAVQETLLVTKAFLQNACDKFRAADRRPENDEADHLSTVASKAAVGRVGEHRLRAARALLGETKAQTSQASA